MTSNQNDQLEAESQNIKLKELHFALRIQKALTTLLLVDEPPDDTTVKLSRETLENAFNEALRGMLYADCKTNLLLHKKRLDNLLNELHTVPLMNKESVLKLKGMVDRFAASRSEYLDDITGYMEFWKNEGWAGLNFILLLLPLILGLIFPPFGIATLIYTSILCALDLVDFAQKTGNYWQEYTMMGIGIIREEDVSALKSHFGEEATNHFLPPPNESEHKPNTFLYGTYVLAFIMGVIGLMGLAFPPLGIPALALTVLGVLAVALAVSQGISIYHKRQTQLQAISQLEKTTEDAIAADNQAIKTLSQLKTTVQGQQVAPQATKQPQTWINYWWKINNHRANDEAAVDAGQNSVWGWIQRMSQSLRQLRFGARETQEEKKDDPHP